MVNFLILVNLFDLVSLVILVIHLVISKGGRGVGVLIWKILKIIWRF